MKKYNVALIGCGTIHSFHADALAACPDTELKAVVDIDISKAERASVKYGCKAFQDYKEVLAGTDIDSIHICTPHYLHSEMAIEAMKAGKHVLTEKPMAISVKECEDMIQASEKTGMQLGVCFQNRYNTTSQYIKRLLLSGKAGRVLAVKASVTWLRGKDYYSSASWRGSWAQEGGGVLINQAIHTLDLLQWFTGKAKRIKGTTDIRFLQDIIEVEDTAEATIQFENGARGFFFATNCYADAPVELQLVCENVILTLTEPLLTIRYGNGEAETISDIHPRTGEKAYYGVGHAALIEDYYACLSKGIPFPVDGTQGISTIRLIQSLYKASEENNWIDL